MIVYESQRCSHSWFMGDSPLKSLLTDCIIWFFLLAVKLELLSFFSTSEKKRVWVNRIDFQTYKTLLKEEVILP